MTSCYFIGISLTSCEKDIYNLEEAAPKQGIKISEKSLEELNQIPVFSDAFRKVQTKTLELKNSTARTELENLYDFTIVPDKVKVMESPDSTISYTFFIERDIRSAIFFENLVIQIDKTGELDAIIMKYIPTGAIVISYHDSFVFEGEKEFTPLITSGRIFYMLNGCVLTTWTTCTWLVTDAQHPEWASEHLAGGYCDDLTHLVNHSSLVCPEGGGNGPGNDSGTEQTSDGGGAPGHVMSTPVLFTVGQLVHKKYIKNLTTTNPILGSCYAEASQEFKDNLDAFFNTLDINDETVTEASIKAFADQAIMAVCGGAQVDFPNRIILDPTFLNNPKAMCVYNKMILSPKFKELFSEIFGENTKPNLTLKVGDLPGNASGGRVGETTISTNNPFDNTITIDTDLLADGHTMSILQAILHECIHAFLNIKLSDSTIGMSIPDLNNLDLPQCINQYYNGFNSPQNQHDFIFTYMTNTMQTIFSQVKNSLITPLENAEIENLILHINQNTNPLTNISTPWNWNDFYKSLSLNGLQSCNAFSTEIATVVPGSPTIIIDQNKWSKFFQYLNVAFSNLPKNCN